jgi:hypothetical protein
VKPQKRVIEPNTSIVPYVESICPVIQLRSSKSRKLHHPHPCAHREALLGPAPRASPGPSVHHLQVQFTSHPAPCLIMQQSPFKPPSSFQKSIKTSELCGKKPSFDITIIVPLKRKRCASRGH